MSAALQKARLRAPADFILWQHDDDALLLFYFFSGLIRFHIVGLELVEDEPLTPPPFCLLPANQ